MLENKQYLTQNFPELFQQGSLIKFQKIEFFNEFKQKKEIYGRIEGYFDESNTFLLKTIYPNNEEEVIHVDLKDFVSIAIRSERIAKTESKEDQEMGTLKRQIEHYFSEENLSKDRYLTSHFDEENCKMIIILDVDIRIIAGFSRIKAITGDKQILLKSILNSDIVEVDRTRLKVRRRNFN